MELVIQLVGKISFATRILYGYALLSLLYVFIASRESKCMIWHAILLAIVGTISDWVKDPIIFCMLFLCFKLVLQDLYKLVKETWKR